MQKKKNAFQMRTDERFTDMVDNWRRAQPKIPSRSEAIRQLVGIGVEASRQAREASNGGEFGDRPAAGPVEHP